MHAQLKVNFKNGKGLVLSQIWSKKAESLICDVDCVSYFDGIDY